MSETERSSGNILQFEVALGRIQAQVGGVVGASDIPTVPNRTVADRAAVPIPVGDLSDTFPVNELPPMFRDSIIELHHAIQAPVGLIGMVEVTVAAFVAQQHINVRPYDSRTGSDVVSIYSLTLGETGEGKTKAFSILTRSIKEWAGENTDQRERDQVRWTAHDAAISREISCLPLTMGSAERAEKERELRASLGLRPWLAGGDLSEASAEGMIDALRQDRPSILLINDEAAGFFGGYGMQAENRERYKSILNSLWSADGVSGRTRKHGAIKLSGARLSVMLAGQPDKVVPNLRDRGDMAHGFLARFLLANPRSMQGFREIHIERPDTPTSDVVAARLLEIYKHDPQTKPDNGFMIEPFIVEWSEAARLEAVEHRRWLEEQIKPGALLEPYKPLIARVVQIAARLAAVFSLMETGEPNRMVFQGRSEAGLPGMTCAPISVENWRAGLAVVWYSFNQWRAVLDGSVATSLTKDAAKVVNHMQVVKDRAKDQGPSQKAVAEGIFTLAAMQRAGFTKGLAGASGDGALGYLRDEVMPYLVERGQVHERTLRQKQCWVLNHE
ncbi:MAG: hypothetical protein VR78_10985 [Hoeflea sp. BRH_c9]|nr:MAG: hypothetical protein VR78_10985 [Hoeflea sp. BRH_c9]